MFRRLEKLPINPLLFIFIALGIFLRILLIARREFWYDEILSLLLVTGQKTLYQIPKDVPVNLSQYASFLNLPVENHFSDTIKTLIQLLRGLVGEPHPPLFFLTQHFWLRWFGNREIAMRSLQVVFSLGTIFSGYGLGKIVLGNRGGLILAALLTLNPFFLFHSLNVRMYCSLVFWVTLGTWMLIELIELPKNKTKKQLFFSLIFILSITAAMLTFYPVIYWLIGVGLLIILQDRSRWWQHGLRLGISILLVIPWLKWGLTQQLRNADFERFNHSQDLFSTLIQQLDNFLQTIGFILLIGDTATRLPLMLRWGAGLLSLSALILIINQLWKQKETPKLMIGICLAIIPFFLAVAMDILTGKFTVGFGWGRAVSFMLPGGLLLLATGLNQSFEKRRNLLIITLLSLYLIINIADFTLRPRQIFHQLNTLIDPQKNTLIVINSKATGHLLRLAYYLPQNANIDLFAQDTVNLSLKLAYFWQNNPNPYHNIIWLDSLRPVWGTPKTEEEQLNYQQQMKTLLNGKFTLEKSQFVSGTWTLDDFMIHLYHKI